MTGFHRVCCCGNIQLDPEWKPTVRFGSGDRGIAFRTTTKSSVIEDCILYARNSSGQDPYGWGLSLRRRPDWCTPSRTGVSIDPITGLTYDNPHWNQIMGMKTFFGVPPVDIGGPYGSSLFLTARAAVDHEAVGNPPEYNARWTPYCCNTYMRDHSNMPNYIGYTLRAEDIWDIGYIDIYAIFPEIDSIPSVMDMNFWYNLLFYGVQTTVNHIVCGHSIAGNEDVPSPYADPASDCYGNRAYSYTILDTTCNYWISPTRTAGSQWRHTFTTRSTWSGYYHDPNYPTTDCGAHDAGDSCCVNCVNYADPLSNWNRTLTGTDEDAYQQFGYLSP